MKNLILITTLTLIFTVSFGQTKINGTFSSTDSWNWYSMRFYSDSLFTHSTWSCGGGGESKGIYKVHDNILTLHYISNDTLKKYSTEKLNCDSLHRNKFNKTQFSFKKRDVVTYKIKKYNSDKIVLNQNKFDFPLYRTKD